MLMICFDVPGPVLVEWMPKGTTNAARYVDTLITLHINIKNCRKRLSAGIVPIYDNERPHMVGLTQSMLTTMKLKVFTHSVYSPDLRPCDYEVFSFLKTFLEGKHFSTDIEVK